MYLRCVVTEVRICILEGSEDESIRIETCCPNKIINITKFTFIFIITPCMLSSYSIITPTTAHI